MHKQLGGLFLLLVCSDMGAKQYIEDTFSPGEERKTIFGNIVLRKVYNKGFIMDTLEGHPALVKGASAAMGAGIAAYDGRLLMKKGRRIKKLGMTILSAGAFSNIYDRLVRGKVIDYIGTDSKKKKISKITVNLADLYILLGTLLGTGHF